jgi:hypothetical protein
MKGLFIPEITAEMFRNGCLESIEALMAEGNIYDVDYSRWIPCTERLPEEGGDYLVTTKWKGSYSGDTYIETNMAVYREKLEEWDCKGVIAWMPLPEPYKAESEDEE